MVKLEGRVALVTGAGRGIGREIAIRLATAGAKVVICSRTVEELNEVTTTVADRGGAAAAVGCDLSRRSETLGLLAEATRHFGPIDILVNNAGVGSSGDMRPLADFRDDFWDLTLEVNLSVPYLLTKAALPPMRQQGWGRVITVASINGRVTTMHAGAYAASKHGVLGLMRSFALEHAREGITVNCLCPGPVKTRMNDIRIQYDADRHGRSVAEQEQQATPIGGRLQPADVAAMALFLCGEEARMITGQAYNIDGGICMA